MDDRYDNQVSPRLALRALANSFQFRGRSTRSELISFWIFGILVNMTVHLLAPAPGEAFPPAFSASLDAIWSLVLSWPFVPLLVRRLHDQDRSWIWAVLWFVMLGASTILLLLPESASGHGTSITLLTFHRSFAWTLTTAPLLIGSMLAMGGILILNLLPGTPGQNRHGPDPRVAAADENTILPAN